MPSSAHYLTTMVTICEQCGGQGYSNAFVNCVPCLNVAVPVHRQCLFGCEDNVLSQHNAQNCACNNHETSETIVRANKKWNESSLSNQSKLGGDSSPIKVNVKRKCNATNSVSVSDCSSHGFLDSLASIDCNERFLKRPCSGHSKPTLFGSSSCSSHKNEPELEKETQLRVQTSIEPNISAHDNPERGQPVIDIIWRGSFNIWNRDYNIVDGVVAHLSVKACEKVYKEACLLPSLLHLEMLPKSDVWPYSFRASGPTDDNIALYFFPGDARCEKGFDDLVNLMIREELVMRVSLSNAELLVFTSNELPLLYWKFQGKYFIWGVFRGKHSNRVVNALGGMEDSVETPSEDAESLLISE